MIIPIPTISFGRTDQFAQNFLIIDENSGGDVPNLACTLRAHASAPHVHGFERTQEVISTFAEYLMTRFGGRPSGVGDFLVAKQVTSVMMVFGNGPKRELLQT